MNDNLIDCAKLFKRIDKDLKEKPIVHSQKRKILVFVSKDEDDDIFIEDIKMCLECDVMNLIFSNFNKIDFTHYLSYDCKNREHQEAIYISILKNHPIKKSICVQNMEYWKGTNWVKKEFKITKWTLNKIQRYNENSYILYNGITYWHIPTVKEELEKL